jgi:UDP-N-acetylglucosamine 3-dehydrogenase
MKPIRIGVVGLGVMGQQHVRVLRELSQFELVAVADPRMAEIGQLMNGIGQLVCRTDPGDLLNDSLDAVVIASPTTWHVEQAELFLRHGVHVLVEKPIAVDVTSATQMATTASANGASLLVGHVERFNPAIDTLRALLANGDLGRILSISARRVGVARPALPSTNVISDLGIHDVDVIQMLTGERPAVLGASGGALPGNLLEDFAFLMLSYGEVAAAVEANWITPLKSRRLSVTGSGGFVDLDYVRQEVTVYEGRAKPVEGTKENFNAIWQTAEPRPLFVEQGEPLKRELAHFAGCIRGECVSGVPTHEAIAALAACQDATDRIRSAASELAVVRND